jgi:hypothetical protein
VSTWLKLLPLDLDEINPGDFIEPTEDVKEGETVIGVVSDDLKKIYTLYQSLSKTASLLKVEMSYRKSNSEDNGRLSQLYYKARALQNIFWVGLNDEFDLWSHTESCDIRTGWRVVEYKKKETPPFLKMFGLSPDIS